MIRPDLLEQLQDVDESGGEGVGPPVRGRGSLEKRNKRTLGDECASSMRNTTMKTRTTTHLT